MNNETNIKSEKINNNSRKKVVIIVSIILVILLIGCIVLLINNKKEKPISDTGHFYGKPSSVKEIDSIDIIYNNGKDNIVILPNNRVNYYTYDETGNSIDNYVDVDTSDIIKYIYDKDLKYLKEYEEVDNVKWSLRINAPGRHCLISSTKTEPKWFKELLEKLNVDDNGYLSNNKSSNNSDNKCLGNLCYKLYDGYYIDESDDNFVNIKYEDNKAYCFYTLEVKDNKYKDEKTYIKSFDWLKKYKVDNITINNHNYSFVDYSEKENLKDFDLVTIYNNKLYDINIHMGAKDKDYENCIDGYNYFKDNLYIK